MATNEIIQCAFLCLVRCSRGIQRAFYLSSPDSPLIGHASGGPVLVKEGKGGRPDVSVCPGRINEGPRVGRKGNWESRLDPMGIAPRVRTVRLLAL